MDAMIFAAGRGTRLGAIGESTPKALLDVGGVTMIERIARRLIAAGAVRLIVNVHHHGGLIEEFLRARDGFGVELHISRELEEPLETGGGLLAAAPHFRRDTPFFLHNVDIISDLDLAGLYAAHGEDAVATVAVNERETKRYLLFDDDGLYGRLDGRDGTRIEVRSPRGESHKWAFAGVHVGSPALLDRITERGKFSILDVYLRIASEGGRILPHDVTAATWLEIGNPERLEAARRLLAAGS